MALQADPENAELLKIKPEVEGVISEHEIEIAQLKSASALASKTPQNTASPPPSQEKWSKEKHPAYQAGYRPPAPPQSSVVEEPEKAVTFAVNDTVMAKWKTGDKSFYPARITAITGSSAKRIYNVKFRDYPNTETLFAHDIKPMSNESKKRKADGAPVNSFANATASIPQANSGVISAAADIDPTLASQARKEPSKVSDGPTRPSKVPRKVKANKELEATKSKWQDFNAKGGKLAKVPKKDSMFRTPDGVNARGMSCFLGFFMTSKFVRCENID